MVKFKHFEVVSGTYVEEIFGQFRIGYSMQIQKNVLYGKPVYLKKYFSSATILKSLNSLWIPMKVLH